LSSGLRPGRAVAVRRVGYGRPRHRPDGRRIPRRDFPRRPVQAGAAPRGPRPQRRPPPGDRVPRRGRRPPPRRDGEKRAGRGGREGQNLLGGRRPMTDRPVSRFVRIWAVATALVGFALLFALGGFVTSFRVGMADPVWPTEPWYLVVNQKVWVQEPSKGFLIE